MAVISVYTLRVRPGRLQEALSLCGEARKIQESIGARVRVWQPVITGREPNSIAYAIECDDLTAWGAFSDKLESESQWQAFVQKLESNPEPALEMVQSALYRETTQ